MRADAPTRRHTDAQMCKRVHHSGMSVRKASVHACQAYACVCICTCTRQHACTYLLDVQVYVGCVYGVHVTYLLGDGAEAEPEEHCACHHRSERERREVVHQLHACRAVYACGRPAMASPAGRLSVAHACRTQIFACSTRPIVCLHVCAFGRTRARRSVDANAVAGGARNACGPGDVCGCVRVTLRASPDAARTSWRTSSWTVARWRSPAGPWQSGMSSQQVSQMTTRAGDLPGNFLKVLGNSNGELWFVDGSAGMSIVVRECTRIEWTTLQLTNTNCKFEHSMTTNKIDEAIVIRKRFSNRCGRGECRSYERSDRHACTRRCRPDSTRAGAGRLSMR